MSKRNRGLGSHYRERALRRDGHECLRCGSTEHLTVDHIVPVALGGSYKSLNNHQTLCYSCNHAKGTHSLSYLEASYIAEGPR